MPRLGRSCRRQGSPRTHGPACGFRRSTSYLRRTRTSSACRTLSRWAESGGSSRPGASTSWSSPPPWRAQSAQCCATTRLARTACSCGSRSLAISVVLLALCARRRFPSLAPAFLWVGGAALSFLDSQLITTQPGVFLCGMGAAVLLGASSVATPGPGRSGDRARQRRRRRLQRPDTRVRQISSSPRPCSSVAWLVGFALRDRVSGAEAAEERALRAERERESAARVAVAEERARMARELHDVVAHAVSVMVLQVGAVRHRMPAASEEAGGTEERRAGGPYGARGDAPDAGCAAAGRRPARAHAAVPGWTTCRPSRQTSAPRGSTYGST